MGYRDKSKGYICWSPTSGSRIVEVINAKSFRDTENNNNLSLKEVPVPHQILHVPIIGNNNDLLNRDEMPEELLVNQQIHIQPVVKPNSGESLSRSQWERRSTIAADYKIYL